MNLAHSKPPTARRSASTTIVDPSPHARDPQWMDEPTRLLEQLERDALAALDRLDDDPDDERERLRLRAAIRYYEDTEREYGMSRPLPFL